MPEPLPGGKRPPTYGKVHRRKLIIVTTPLRPVGSGRVLFAQERRLRVSKESCKSLRFRESWILLALLIDKLLSDQSADFGLSTAKA